MWIKYKYICNVVDGKEILLEKRITYSEENLAIAEAEAYNGEYTIEEDAEFNFEPPTVQDTAYPGCYYRMINGEKEWINPPMIYDNAYRTAERYHGRPVYVLSFYYEKFESIDQSIPQSFGVGFNKQNNKIIDVSGVYKEVQENGTEFMKSLGNEVHVSLLEGMLSYNNFRKMIQIDFSEKNRVKKDFEVTVKAICLDD